jgi:hypothetical protein
MDFIQGIQIDAPQARFKRGLQSVYGFSGDDFKRAKADLDAAIEGGVNDPRAFWGRAMLNLITTGKEKDSIEDLRKAVELAPLEANFRINLAQVLSGVSVRTNGLTVSYDDDEALKGEDEELAEAELNFGLACELEPENDNLREARDRFHELLSKRTQGK